MALGLVILAATIFSSVLGLPTAQSLPDVHARSQATDPVPGQSSLYDSYTGVERPFPANRTAPIPATLNGNPAPDDVIFQNLAAAEWAIFTFYQQGIEAFNESTFTDLGLPNTTYQRLLEIRDNEAGHLQVFLSSISPASTKPGSCEYHFRWETAEEFLAILNIIEVSSMAFATGLAQKAELKDTVGALVAIGETETRHETWALIDIWNTDPFGGPIDTIFRYPNEILYITAVSFILPGTCPAENPEYPYPSQHLPQLSFNASTSTGQPGSPITFLYTNDPPHYNDGTDYYAVFFHGLANISVPFDVATGQSKVPEEFEDGKGIIIAVIADEIGAPNVENLIAGPLILLQQPPDLTGVSGS